jgi:hypothetical protein
MSDVAIALRGWLLSRPALTSVIGQRLYTDILPQNPVLPAVTFSKIYTSHDHTLSNLSGVAHTRFQFDCYATTRAAANQIAEIIRSTGIVSRRGMTGGVEFLGVRMEEGQRNFVDYTREDSDDHRYVTNFDLVIDFAEA